MAVRATLRGCDVAAEELLVWLAYELADAAARGAELVAASARASHPYTNRTGELEERTQGAGSAGGFLQGTLVGRVEAAKRYATFVDEGTSRSRPYPFLLPAFEREAAPLVDVFEASMREAAQRAGWIVS